MSRPAVLVLGAGGMLGHMVTTVLSRDDVLDVTATTRPGGTAPPQISRVTWQEFDATHGDLARLLDTLPTIGWVVNAIGVIKPFIGDDLASRHRAIDINADFPHRLTSVAADRGVRVIQPATDCVFSGTCGPYSESSPHDPTDVYGKTKSLGEVPSEVVMHLRASIIGPELGTPVSLLGWLLSRERDADLVGFDNHLWNGVTTLEFARVTAGVIRSEYFVPGACHLVPADEITKGDLLVAIAKAFGRDDLRITMSPASEPIDRRLTTSDFHRNHELWSIAGYDSAPAIGEMLTTLSRFP
ncbi:MAG: sugar nucleotide-binding protein [Acidimicrobiales bacterium]